jgi:hypothetical protein
VTELALTAPRGVDELYLARHDEVSPARPLMPGDVLAGVGGSHAMIVAHPCSMRGSGGRLRPRVAVAPVSDYQRLPLSAWPSGHFNVFPLPELLPEPCAAKLLELSSATREELEAAERVATLSDYGVYVFQQRFVFCLTRVVVGLDRLEEVSGHLLAEAELEEEWVDELTGGSDSTARSAQRAAFQTFLNGELRASLQQPLHRSEVRRTVRAEIARRRASEA